MIRQIGVLPDEQRERVVAARSRALRAIQLRPCRIPPMPDPDALLCGCATPTVGPTVVRLDGSCAACSP